MFQDKEPVSIRSDPEAVRDETAVSRKEFLAEMLGISVGVSALLTEMSAAAQNDKEGAASTALNINSGFDVEAQVAAKYAAFTVQAKADGYPQAARLLQALMAAENFHSEWFFRLMKGVSNTADNLKAAADLETHLSEKVLPSSAAQAGRDKNPEAEDLFKRMVGACSTHAKVLRQARERIAAGSDLEPGPIWICPKCGAVVAGAAPDKCTVCATPKARLIAVT